MAAPVSKSPAILVREAQIEDASRIAELSAQLGYPASRADVERRMIEIKQGPGNVVYVAVLQDGEVIGWVHAFVCRVLESDSRAEIGGLVVDEAHRPLGRRAVVDAARRAMGARARLQGGQYSYERSTC